jgi:hypothetical protein
VNAALAFLVNNRSQTAPSGYEGFISINAAISAIRNLLMLIAST